MIYFNDSFINMCIGNQLLQKVKMDKGVLFLDKGDYYCDNDSKEVCIVIEKEVKLPLDKYTWLPTLDDLNDIISYDQFTFNAGAIFEHWKKEAKYLRCINENDGKMTMLARYMQLHGQLMWNNGKWVEIKSID